MFYFSPSVHLQLRLSYPLRAGEITRWIQSRTECNICCRKISSVESSKFVELHDLTGYCHFWTAFTSHSFPSNQPHNRSTFHSIYPSFRSGNGPWSSIYNFNFTRWWQHASLISIETKPAEGFLRKWNITVKYYDWILSKASMALCFYWTIPWRT